MIEWRAVAVLSSAQKSENMRHWLFKILIIGVVAVVLLLLVTACSGPGNRAPVHDRHARSVDIPAYHIVSKGETLFSIAWRYGLDYRKLAQRNGISSAYTIYPGQKIYFRKSVSGAGSRSVKKSSSPGAVVSVNKPTPAAVPRSKTSTVKKPAKAPQAAPAGQLQWRWPARGKVIATFSSQNTLNKGIDIEGRLGEPVLAAAPGKVVYAGDGIRGYGNLLIIKHNDTYLSAYAHNSRLLVKEQQAVKAGEKIAEIGSSGTDITKLHFEIRREGKPTDPRNYLPRR